MLYKHRISACLTIKMKSFLSSTQNLEGTLEKIRQVMKPAVGSGSTAAPAAVFG